MPRSSGELESEAMFHAFTAVSSLAEDVIVIFCHFVYFREMSKPINVLTGIDYWLDNLICNVPELAMCYHDNGIVRVCYFNSWLQHVHSQKMC
jgi:hypothetical protein